LTRDQLLSALANRIIDMAADTRYDVHAQFERSDSLDRLRRLRIVCLKLEPMVRALAEHIAQTDRGNAHTDMLDFADTLHADGRALARDIAALEDDVRRQESIPAP
jgi:hypothetical protein